MILGVVVFEKCRDIEIFRRSANSVQCDTEPARRGTVIVKKETARGEHISEGAPMSH